MTEWLEIAGVGNRTQRALLRSVGVGISRLGGGLRGGARPDHNVARDQQMALALVLKDALVSTIVLDGVEGSAEACCVGDLVLPIGLKNIVICRPCAPARMGEENAVVRHLGTERALHFLPSGTSLDASDVVVVGSRILVAPSARTNRQGIAFLERLAKAERFELVTVQARGEHRLASVISPLWDGLVLHLAGSISRESLQGFELIPSPEAAGARVLTLGDRVIMAAEAPRTADLLSRRGIPVDTTPLSEFLAAGVSLARLVIAW